MAREPKRETGRTFENWNGSARSAPACYVEPADLTELLAVVQGDPARFPAPVRAVGHWHSLNDCVVADGGTQVAMAGFTGVTLDTRNQRVTVGAGVSMLEIARALLPHGLQLPVMPEIGNATAGSVACCGTKDSSLGAGPGQVSSAVTGMTVVTPRGVETVTEESDPERLALLRCSYGLLGIVATVTFRTVPAQVLEFKCENLRFKDVPTLAEVRQGADGFLAFLEPHHRSMVVERRTVDPRAPALTLLDRQQCEWRTQLWKNGGSLVASLAGLPALLEDVRHLPLTQAVSKHLGHTADELITLGLEHLHFRARRHDTMIEFEAVRPHYFDFAFFAFPTSRWQEIVPGYLEFCDEFARRHDGFRPSLPTEIYSIARDQASPLSVSFDEDAFTLDMVHHRVREIPFDARWTAMNEAFNEFAAAHGGRPLLNQTKRLTGTLMRTVLRHTPGLAPGWERLRAQADPRFTSPYFRQLF
jgi:FAD/FMN-containing dehydrogenase